METKPQNIENYLKALGLPISISLHQECHINCQFTYHGYFPTIMEKAETLCISPILSYSRSSEKSSSRYGHNNSNNSSLTKQSLYPKILQISISNPILILLTFYWTQRLKRTSCDKQDTAIRGLCSFWEKLSAEELSEQAISLSLLDFETIDTINIMNHPEQSGLAGFVIELWIPFVVI